MRLQIKVKPLVLPLLYLTIVFLFVGKYPFVQAEKGDVTFKILSEIDSSEATDGKEKVSYVTKILDEKHDELSTESTHDEDTEGPAEDTVYDKTEEMTSNSAERTSSSEEIEEKSIVFGSNSPTTSGSKLNETFSSLHQNKLQVLTKVQQPRLVRQQKPEGTNHNWYVYKNGQHGRSVDAAEMSKPGSESSNDGSGKGGTVGGLAGGGTGRPTGSRRYNVRRPNPLGVEKVDPENGYNFFQFKPYSRLGLLWLYKPNRANKLKAKSVDDLQGPLDHLNDNDEGSDASDKYDWEFKRYDRACLYLEYKKQKSDAVVPIIIEELKRIVDGQNELLARKFLDWQFIGKESHNTIALQDQAEEHPLYLSYKFLLTTMEIFRDKICRNISSYAVASAAIASPSVISKAAATAQNMDTKFLPKAFIDDIFRLFLSLREITLPKNIPDYATSLDEEEILKGVLEKCRAEEKSINWFAHSCGDQVLSNDFANNFACTPLVDYDFNTRLYDPIIDAMWHMFNAVHAYCFKHFQANTKLWHKYSLIMANTFTNGMKLRWKASMASESFYKRLLGPDHEVHFETMNRCMFGAVLRSDVPALLPRFDTPSPTTFGKERMINKDATVASSEMKAKVKPKEETQAVTEASSPAQPDDGGTE